MEAAGLEAAHGDIDVALDMFTASIDSFHQAGSTTDLGWVFGHLTVFFDRTGQPEIAATFYGTSTHNPNGHQTNGFAAAIDHLRDTLGPDTFDTCARTGATMTPTETVHYAHHHIQTTRQHQP